MNIIKIIRYQQASEMLREIENFLLREEHLNGLMLGILNKIKKDDKPDDLYCLIKDQEDQLVMLMSGLHIILFANTIKPIIYEEAIRFLESNQIKYPGIIGPNHICEAFHDAYQKIKQATLSLAMRQRIFVCNQVNEVDSHQGELVLAHEQHQDFLLPWMIDFRKITNEDVSTELSKARLEELISQKLLYILLDQNEIVSMAAGTRPFRSTISVGYVYTPPHLRNKGYATKCVKCLTEYYLKTYDYCSLYTDLANPTSNSIYQKIGYKPVGDSLVYVKDGK